MNENLFSNDNLLMTTECTIMIYVDIYTTVYEL